MKPFFFFVSALALMWILNGPARAIQFEEVSDTAGISFSGGSWGASWGDFNGDGKPDIWVSDCTTSTRFVLNNGDGTFTDASNLVVGASSDAHGAAWADFDNDGDQDLLQLVGTQLFLTAAGMTQFREQVGGMHAKAQNHQRIHFGLAENETVDNLTVIWPSGIRQEITNISANQIVRIVEPSAPGDSVGSRVGCDDQYVPPEEYWTPERMEDAVPRSIEIEVPESGKEENIQDESEVPVDANPGFAPESDREQIAH